MCACMRACSCTCMRACMRIDLFALYFPITLYARLYVRLYAHLYVRLYAHWPFCTWFPHHPVRAPVRALTFLHFISPSPCTRACTRIDLFALYFPITLYAHLYAHWPFCTWFAHHPVRTPVRALVHALTFLHLISQSPCTRACMRIDLFALYFPITLYARLYTHWPFCTLFPHHPARVPVRALTFLHFISPITLYARIDLFALYFPITLYACLYARLYAHWPFCTLFPHHPVRAPVRASVRALTFLHFISPSPCTRACTRVCTRIDLFALYFPITLYVRLYARLYAHWPFCTLFPHHPVRALTFFHFISPSPCTCACTRIDLFALYFPITLYAHWPFFTLFPHHPVRALVRAPVRALTFLHFISPSPCTRIDLFSLYFPITLYVRLYAHWPFCTLFPHHPVRALTFLHLISPSPCTRACTRVCMRIDLFALYFPITLYARLYACLYMHWPFCTLFPHHPVRAPVRTPVCAPVRVPVRAPVRALTFLHFISPSPCARACTRACTRVDLFALYFPITLCTRLYAPVLALTSLHFISPSPCMRACTHVDLFALYFPITLCARLYAHLYARLYSRWPFCTLFPHHPVRAPVCALTFLHFISPSPCVRACTRACTRVDLFALYFPITLYARLYTRWPFCTLFPHHPVRAPVCASVRAPVLALSSLHFISPSPCTRACTRACTRVDLFALYFPITLCACLYVRLYAHLYSRWPFCTLFPHHPVRAPVRAPAEFWLVRILEGPHHIQSYSQHLTT